MATVVFILILATVVVNAIVQRSETQWWRDPGSLLREGGALYSGRRRDDPVTEGREPVAPGTVAPGADASGADGRAPLTRRHAGTGSWDAVADREPATEVLQRVPGAVSRRPAPDHEWETEIIRRVTPRGAQR
jgi:hypothetical protein